MKIPPYYHLSFLERVQGSMAVSAAVEPMGYSMSSAEVKNRLLHEEEGEITYRQDLDSIRGQENHVQVRRNPFRRVVSPTSPPGSVVGGFGLPNLSTIWSESSSGIIIVQNVEFTIIQKAFESHLRFLHTERPGSLEKYLTEVEWIALRSKMDEIGMRVRWDVNRSLFLVILIFVMVVILNLGDDIGGSFSLGDGQQCILIVLGIILLKLIFDEIYETCTRRYVLFEMDEVCRQYSDIMRPRGVCVAFRFEDNDDHGLLVDLVFYKVMSTETRLLDIA